MNERPWVEKLEDPVGEETVHRIWQGVQRRRAPRSRARPVAWGAGLAAAALVGFWLWTSFDDGAVSAPPGPLAQSTEEGVRPLGERIASATRFDDGSRVVPAEGTSLSILANSGNALTTLMSEGAARFDVTPGGPRRWTIECGIAQVEVVGTEFTIDRDPARVRVEVERGVVLVRSSHLADGVRRLTRGESVEVRGALGDDALPDTEGAVAEGEASETAASETGASETGASETASETGASETGASETGASETGASETGASETGASETGASEAAASEAAASASTLADRMTEADEARSAGRAAEAESILERALRAHPNAPERALAYYTLARLRLDSLRRYGSAAAAYDAAISAGLPAAIAEEAMVRRVEAYARAERPGAAQRAAEAHASRYPSSARRAEVARWIDDSSEP